LSVRGFNDGLQTGDRSSTLSSRDVHLWRIPFEQTDDVCDRLTTFLSIKEKARADRFVQAIHRRNFRVGRGALRAILADYLSAEATEIEFDQGPQGKPALAGRWGDSGLQFNLTHSGGLAVLGVCRDRAIGVDIEAIEPRQELERLVTRFFAPHEVEEFLGLPEELRVAGFFRTWTRKEAYIKAIGTGLYTPLESFDVGVHPESRPGLLRVAHRPDDVELWQMADFDPGGDYMGSIVVERFVGDVQILEFALA
jgi:4'-phosphopantetheinyl transferase